ncbi:MAG TPA: glycosyltransferase family 39 protein [Burkholderiaceae bacterium]|nr:glycosyltransferase family 39 protein [Burkholderiaceae bacterium]HNB43447.1 glycosyltransferase family 39 protein [Burkholderiaceae bacterium]HNG80000.1 glycosyltransferase family 39 protein [Burkholderiaceae bacterium]
MSPAAPSLPFDAAAHARRVALQLLGLAGLFWLARLVLLGWVCTDPTIGLHVDEAQYWHWSRDLQWGYYSKPPMVALLIALSTALGGDGLIGVKWLVMATHPLAAAVTGWLAYAMTRAAFAQARGSEALTDATQAEATLAWRVALAAALIVVTSPMMSLLGMAATTDGPLMLTWALAAGLGWRLVHSGRRGDAVALGIVLGLGVLSKYTFLALAPTLAIWVLWPTAPGLATRRERWFTMGLAAGIALAICLPHILWNASHGWPTVRHTLDITVQQAEYAPQAAAAGWRGFAEFVGGQILMFGPMCLVLLRWGRATPVGASGSAAAAWSAGWGRQRAMALSLSLPLLAVGLAQAAASKAQINWTAPAVVGIALALSLWWGQRAASAQRADATGGEPMRPVLSRAALAVLALQFVGASLAVVASVGRIDSVKADLWSRMRGWDVAFRPLQPQVQAHLAAHPGAQVIALDRTVLVQAAYAWRDLHQVNWLAWREPGARWAQHHYELVTRWAEPGSAAARAPVLILAAGTEADGLPQHLRDRLGPLQALARVERPQIRGEHTTYTLWRAQRLDSAEAAQPASAAAATEAGVSGPIR